MKVIYRFLLPFFLVSTLSLPFLLSNCKASKVALYRGEVQGIFEKAAWEPYQPDDMVLIPGGSFMMGSANEDVVGRVFPSKRVSVSSFYMDAAPVTNRKYLQFIETFEEQLNEIIKERQALEKAATESAEQDAEEEEEEQEDSTVLEVDTEEKETLKQERIKLAQDRAAQIAAKKAAEASLEAFLVKIRPNPLVWQEDFLHQMSEPQVENYFGHPAFYDYPVVGISWEAAREYAKWRTEFLNEYRTMKGLSRVFAFSLPTAIQFEYAARGGNPSAKYPWGGPYVRDDKGGLLANFKVSSGNYNESGYAYTSPVKSFPPNDYGLYDMAGNVSEWCLDAWNFASVSETWDLNPTYFDNEEPRKVIMGGSWKDISYYLQTGVRDYEYKDVPRSYIGFRCVMPCFDGGPNANVLKKHTGVEEKNKTH